MSYAIRDKIPGGEYGRLCDVCLRYANTKDLRKVDYLWVCNKHPGYISRRQLDTKPLIRGGPPEPIREAKPFEQRATYEGTEITTLRFLYDWTPGSDTFDVGYSDPVASNTTTGTAAAAWSAIYFHGLLSEDQRPYSWMDLARAKLRELGDWLIAKQLGGGVACTYTANTGAAYGGIGEAFAGLADTFLLDKNAGAGLAFLYCYEDLGDTKYLDAARRTAWFIRTMQCGHLQVSQPSSLASGGAPAYYFGAHSSRMITSGTTAFQDHRYYLSGLLSTWFLTEYQRVVGDESIGSSTSITPFPASRAKLVSECITDALAFWTNGQGGVIGTSSATPREYFDAYPASKYNATLVGTNAWAFADGSSTITAANWAMGIHALHKSGQTTTAAAMFDYLMTYESNSTYELPATTTGRIVTGYDDRYLWAGTKGTYLPEYALAEVLDTTTVVNDSPIMDLGTAGLLAPLYSTKQPAYFAELKYQLSINRPRSLGTATANEGHYLYLGILGKCGMSWQPYTSAALARTASIYQAALMGLLFREAPTNFGGRGIQ